MTDLSNKVVLITGASRGIGAEAAKAFRTAGASVAIAARNTETLSALAAELGGETLAVECDVSSYEAVQSAVGQAKDRFGKLDVLVNNAALVEPIGHLADTDPEAWGKLIDVNIKGVYFGMHAAIPHMVAAGTGTILNISSGAAHIPIRGFTAYCTSKAGAIRLTEIGHGEYGGDGLRIMALSPGSVATDMQRIVAASGDFPGADAPWSDHIAPDWPARALVWMCSADADEFLGKEISLRDEDIRRRVGLLD